MWVEAKSANAITDPYYYAEIGLSVSHFGPPEDLCSAWQSLNKDSESAEGITPRVFLCS